MAYTLGQAAKATGRSKPTIQRAIKNGTISALRATDGSYEIDPAELHRVFPPANDTGNAEQVLKQTVLPSDAGMLQREIDLLRERLADKDAVIDDLRHRLDAEAEERRKLTAILTDQRTRSIITPPPEKPPAAKAVSAAQAPAKRRWWSLGRQ
jgi:excisionase family DNA binding protein